MKKKLSVSQEDYLEAIFNLESRARVARVKDIAAEVGVQTPSVTVALKNLRDRRLIHYQKNSYITLTETGMRLAKTVQKRHKLMVKFFSEILLLSAEVAEKQACDIEHHINPQTTNRFAHLITLLNDYRQQNGIDDERWRQLLDQETETDKSND